MTGCVTESQLSSMQDLGHGETLTYAPWPMADESLLVEDTVNLPVQASELPLASNRHRSFAD